MIPTAIKKEGKVVFKIGQCLGTGGFGEVRKAMMIGRGEIAIKFQLKSKPYEVLAQEIKVLQSMSGTIGFPNSIGNGSTINHHFVAMQLLGGSLLKIYKDQHKFFGLTTVLKIGIQVLDRLEHLHAKNIVHGDLKPENIVLGLNDTSTLHLIDFGLSTEIPDADQRCVAFRTNKVRGTLKYMSINAHNAIVAFKNDIESLAYLLVFFNRSTLPWETECTKKRSTETIERVVEMKKSIETYSKVWPVRLQRFLEASRAIGNCDRPDYNALRNILM